MDCPLPASPPNEYDFEDFEDEYDPDDVDPNYSKIWAVSGIHELYGDVMAKTALNNGTFGFAITGHNSETMVVRGPLGPCLVSKEGWEKSALVYVGDTLYMEHDGVVYKGRITDQPIKGPFCSLRSLENSFFACLGVHSDEQLGREVEIVFKVDWKRCGDMNDDWADFMSCLTI